MMGYNVQPLRTTQEMDGFLFGLRRSPHAERDVFLFLLGINSGLRMSDPIKLKKKDIVSTKNPRIIEQKTGKTRILYLSSLQDLIQDYTKDLEPEEYLFPSSKGDHLEVNTVYQMFQKVAATLMEIFGHSSETITKRYIGINKVSLISSSLISI